MAIVIFRSCLAQVEDARQLESVLSDRVHQRFLLSKGAPTKTSRVIMKAMEDFFRQAQGETICFCYICPATAGQMHSGRLFVHRHRYRTRLHISVGDIRHLHQ